MTTGFVLTDSTPNSGPALRRARGARDGLVRGLAAGLHSDGVRRHADRVGRQARGRSVSRYVAHLQNRASRPATSLDSASGAGSGARNVNAYRVAHCALR